MYCRNCGTRLEDSDKFCPECGARVDFAPQVQTPTPYTRGTPSDVPTKAKSKTTAGLLAIFLGGLGIHKFYLGLTTPGAIMVVVWLFAFFTKLYLLCVVLNIIGLIEGVIYLTKTSEQFHEYYEVQKKEWF